MAKDFSFDIVSDYDLGEMTNAVDQSKREIVNRYDFKNTPAGIDFLSKEKNGVRITGDSRFQLDAVLDVFKKKLAKRGIPLGTLDTSVEPKGEGKVLNWDILFKKGLDKEKSKKLTKLIKESGPKVKTQIQDESIRVTGSSKDDLQAVMTLVSSQDLDFPVQFVNYR